MYLITWDELAEHGYDIDFLYENGGSDDEGGEGIWFPMGSDANGNGRPDVLDAYLGITIVPPGSGNHAGL